MGKYKFKVYLEREIEVEGESAIDARFNLINEIATMGKELKFEASDYIDDGVEVKLDQ